MDLGPLVFVLPEMHNFGLILVGYIDVFFYITCIFFQMLNVECWT